MDRIAVILCMGVCALIGLNQEQPVSADRIGGVSLEATRDSVRLQDLSELYANGVGWVAVIPFAFSRPNDPAVIFNQQRQWWGESVDGVRHTIRMAHAAGLQVMIKPHVWVRGQGWPGEFTLENDSLWQIWEHEYRQYIVAFAEVAADENAGMLCIGTEFRIAARERPQFWQNLINEIRKIYNGKITYAANWDNYDQITFWSSLDYIGIDAYFPLSESRVPEVSELQRSWKELAEELGAFNKKYNKPVLFTEYGYRSTEYSADGHWKHESAKLQVNNQAQSNAYEAVFTAIWREPWFAGGFLWKWHLSPSHRDEFMEKAYSPQGKPAQQIIFKHYRNP